jgi:hypothetical protein
LAVGGEWRYFGREDLIDGNKQPKSDLEHNAEVLFAALLSPRLKSLIWAAKNRPAAFGPALFTFARRRQHSARKDIRLLPSEGWSVLALIPVIDHLRVPLGADWDSLAGASSWPRILFDAVDDVVQAMWLLRAGATIPAAILTRTLLERWTYNVAHHHGLEQSAGESDSDYISRVWRVYAKFGVPTYVGSWWGTLSELAHGRQTAGRLGLLIVGAAQVDSGNNLDIHKGICGVLDLCLKQIRGALGVVVVDAGHPEYIPMLQCSAPSLSVSDEPFDLMEAYQDLDYYEAHRVLTSQWTELAEIYRQNLRDSGQTLAIEFNPVFTIEALLERRGRAIERSRAAFKIERQVLGEEFDPGYLAARLFRYACFSELGRLLVSGDDGPEDAALLTASQCLESAVHLWLEDSDHSMGFLRAVLEQTARLRVHRLKRARALNMEARGDASATRWLEAAGWRRLSLVLRAVNEYAHLGRGTRREGARRALLQVQLDNAQAEKSRGGALDSVASLLAFELHARLRLQSEDAAGAFIDSVTLIDEAGHLQRLELYLDNAHAHRDLDFGEPDFES